MRLRSCAADSDSDSGGGVQDAREDIDLTADDILSQVANNVGRTSFVGYHEMTLEKANVLSLVQQGRVVQSADEGAAVDIVLCATPFYAESGGQIGDKGTLVVRAPHSRPAFDRSMGRRH